ncbi:MAG: prolipoprotein diacylglyceryl transferase [Rhizobiaceae bacterium]|nr:prolipoprotein diacylglyceryl transferase [Rhizobiaceae bacterium]
MISAAETLALLPFPDIDPVAISIGPVDIRWYGLGYVVSILLGWWYARRIVATPRLWANDKPAMTALDLDDFLLWAAIGIVAGGRIGFILFYDLPLYLADPALMLQIWKGGMSFHGGITGTAIAMILFARKRGIGMWSLFDIVSTVCVTGLFLVRIANFINGELWGKISFLPWAVIFPGEMFPRHPSQLYEAGLEGLLTGLVLAWLVFRRGALKRPGLVAGVFVSLYAACRIGVEFVREPDAQLGYLLDGWLTMGMLLSLPMLLLGLWAIWRANRAAMHRA